MIVFMALAEGDSFLRVGPLTLHTESAIHIAERLTGASFSIRKINQYNHLASLVVLQIKPFDLFYYQCSDSKKISITGIIH